MYASADQLCWCTETVLKMLYHHAGAPAYALSLASLGLNTKSAQLPPGCILRRCSKNKQAMSIYQPFILLTVLTR